MENKEILCDYGCGQIATHQFKNGKWCCSKSSNQCLGKKSKHNQSGIKNPMFKKIPWNKGLTKDIDERLKKYGEKGSQSKLGSSPWNKGLTSNTSEIIKQSSEKMSKTKKGKPNLKRRQKLTLNKIRSKLRLKTIFRQRLYCDFTFPVMERDNFECKICKSKNNLEVHHLKPFKEIFDEAILNINLPDSFDTWTDIDIELLEKEILSNHNTDMGITVCINCHKKIDKKRK